MTVDAHGAILASFSSLFWITLTLATANKPLKLHRALLAQHQVTDKLTSRRLTYIYKSLAVKEPDISRRSL